MTRLGFQIPNFTLPGIGHADLYERLALIARTAEESGFDTVLAMDHFYQLPALGPPENEMLECYALLSALAGATERVHLSALVTGVTYRNPAHLAKIVTTLDVVSGGRAQLGIGAAWFEPEHVGLGFDFPPLGQRLAMLEEALEIITAMFRGERATIEGRYYRVVDVINSPPPLQPGGPPILIGGNGEKKTLRLVAKYATDSNLTCPPAEIPRKLDALAAHCDALGRDPATISKTWLGSLVMAPTFEEAERARNEFLAARGMNWDALPDAIREMVEKAIVLGDPDTVGEFVRRELIDRGLDGVIVNLPANGHEPDAIRLAGETLQKAIA